MSIIRPDSVTSKPFVFMYATPMVFSVCYGIDGGDRTEENIFRSGVFTNFEGMLRADKSAGIVSELFGYSFEPCPFHQQKSLGGEEVVYSEVHKSVFKPFILKVMIFEIIRNDSECFFSVRLSGVRSV